MDDPAPEEAGAPGARVASGDPVPTDDVNPTPSGRARRRTVAVLAAAVVLVVAVGVVVVVAVMRGGSSEDVAEDRGVGLEVVTERGPVTHSYVVPAGTRMRIERGMHVEVVPERLEVRVGDTIQIRNDDNVEAEVGVFRVAPGRTVTMRFTEPGRLEGYCSVDPSGRFVIDVIE